MGAMFLFLTLMCLGVALNIALVVYFMKRPARPLEWGESLVGRAMSGRALGFLFALIMTMYLGCSVLYVSFYPDVKELEASALLFQGLFFNIPALLILLGVLICRRVRSDEPMDLSWSPIPKLIGLSVLLYIATIPVMWFYSLLNQFLLHQLGFDVFLQEVAQVFLEPAPLLTRSAMCFVAVVLAPAVEELFFRGALFPWMIRRAGFWSAVFLNAFFFAAIHMHLPSFVPLFLLSAIFCVVYARTRSLLVPICMHACFNGISLLLLSLTSG
jgi:hypothetical protein